MQLGTFFDEMFEVLVVYGIFVCMFICSFLTHSSSLFQSALLFHFPPFFYDPFLHFDVSEQ